MLILGTFHSHGQSGSTDLSIAPGTINIEKFTYKIIPSIANTWGYRIYQNGKLKIDQPTIPGVPGNAGFKSKDAAERVAVLAIEKMKKGEIPPTVTAEELKQLNAL